MGGSTCRLSVKIFDLCWLSLIFLSPDGNFFLVLSVVSNIFSPFVASWLTPFTPSVRGHTKILVRYFTIASYAIQMYGIMGWQTFLAYNS